MRWGRGRACRCSPWHRWEEPDLLEALAERLVALPPGAVYAVIAVLAAVENILPPVPADTAVAIGAFVSAGGAVSASVVFAITWGANVLGSVGVYFLARRVGRPAFQGRMGQRLLTPGGLARLEQLYRRYGTWGIFLSRFVPGVRAIVPPFAGIAGLGPLSALAPTVVASGLWYGLLVVLVARFARQIQQVLGLVDRLGLVAALIALAVAGGAIALRWRRRRRVPRPTRD